MNEPAARRSPWTIPAFLGIGSAFALIASLAADGVWDWISWLLLALPLVIVGWAFFRK